MGKTIGTELDELNEASEKIAECIAKLPTESADAIADFFREKGIKGIMSQGTMCPIATFIKQCSGYDNIYVARNKVGTLRRKPCANSDCQSPHFGFGNTLRHNTPAMQEFTRNFDQGDYIDLRADK